MLPNPTFDQLQVFVAVAETGSFSAAARQMGRAQSVVSYTIANLEAQLQLTLFDRQGRSPVLTDAGKAILENALRILADLDGLRARSKALTEGLEGEVRLAVSVMIPDHLLMQVLAEFQARFSTVLLKLTVGSPFLVARMVEDGEADIGVGGPNKAARAGVVENRIGFSFMLPVAAPDHRLARLDRPLTAQDVADEIQIVVSDPAHPDEGRGFNIISRRTWRVSDMSTKRQLLVGGLGWGGVPVAMLHDDLRERRLVRLEVEPYDSLEYPIAALWRSASPPGPAGRWLLERMTAALSRCPASVHEMLEALDPPVERSAASRAPRVEAGTGTPHRRALLPQGAK